MRLVLRMEGALPTHEEVVCIWYVASHSKQLHQVVELAMNITAYLDLGISHRSEHHKPRTEVAHTVTGAITVVTFPSSMRSSRALWQISRTWASGIGRHERNCAIALSIGVSWADPKQALSAGEAAVSLTCRGRS